MFGQPSNPYAADATDKWLQWAAATVTTEAGIVLESKPNESLQTPDIELLEADPVLYLQQASAWMGYYNSNVTLWASVHKKLETRYTTLKDRSILESTAANPKLPLSKAESMARVHLADLREAITIAENRERSFTTKYYSAMANRDLVSRSITARESDRKVTRQW